MSERQNLLVKGISQAANTINEQSKGMAMQAYALSVDRTQDLNFGGQLAAFNSSFNGYLERARVNSRHYLNSVQPAIIKTAVNFETYLKSVDLLNQALSNATRKDKQYFLDGHLEQVRVYKGAAQSLAAGLVQTRDLIGSDIAALGSANQQLASHIGGSREQINHLKQQLLKCENDLSSAQIGGLGGAGAVVGGVIAIALGTLFPPLGWPFMAGGAVLISGGTLASATQSSKLAQLLKTRRQLTERLAAQQLEIAQVESIGSAFLQLHNQGSQCHGYAQSMYLAWEALDYPLAELRGQLERGVDLAEERLNNCLKMATYHVDELREQVKNIRKQWRDVDCSTYVSNTRPVDELCADAVRALGAH